MESEEFLSLPESKLVEILGSDELVVDKEETVFIAAVNWLKVSRFLCY